jgi:tetratricopeptide (TPR) repeat protein
LITDEHRRAGILLELGWSEHHAGHFPAASEAFERGLASPASAEDPELATELEAGYLAQRIWADGQLLRDEGAESHALWHVIGALSWADAYGPVLEAIEHTLQAADEQGLALAHAQARYARSWPNYWMGRLRESQTDARAAIEIWHGGLETYLPAAIYWFGLASLELDEPVRAERGPPALPRPAHGGGAGLPACVWRGDELADDHQPGVMPWRTHAARALRALGESDQARGLAEEELELARSSGGGHERSV